MSRIVKKNSDARIEEHLRYITRNIAQTVFPRSTEAMKSDSLFYTYFQLLPEALLLLAGEDVSLLKRAKEFRFQSVEVKELAFRMDGILALADFQERFFFVEVQYQRDKRLYRRIFAQINIFLYQQNPVGAWRVVVVFPKRSIDAGVPDDYAEYLASGRLKVVYLDELPREILQEFPLSLLQIMNAKPDKNAVEAALKHVIATANTTREDDDFHRLIFRMASAKLNSLPLEEIESMMNAYLVPFEKTRAYKDILAREKRAEERGMEKGMEKGMRQATKLAAKIEHENKLKAAQKLIALGLTIEQIIEVTGLRRKEIKTLMQ
ncbi:MAG: Rpn family recombination-promoting nuclease/putative transposase [Candidatus Kapabacteria bacterium]|jgi:predicted transposase/invertase (TIGR01784 family)|nr:Rpn family recombination-promoting nuclease/putative transposase [Candidatus Kapabacteria bacterium]